MSDQPTSVSIWMPWFIKDHLATASTLDHEEHSVLCYFKMLLWQHQGVLPDDDHWIAKRVRIAKCKWSAMRPTIIEDCTAAGGKITHPTIAAEHAKAVENVEKKRKAGLASAAARAAKAAGEQTGNIRSTGVGTHVQPRAGEGEGTGPEDDLVTSTTVREKPFRVLDGGAS